MSNEKITTNRVMFIKLGRKGEYEQDCIKRGIMKLEYGEIDDALCQVGDWDGVRKEVMKHYGSGMQATSMHANQIQRFYEETQDTLWLTFSEGVLHYGFAEPTVRRNDDGTSERTLVGGWKSTDKDGDKLFIQSLSGNLTKVQGYRGTICEVHDKDYLLRRINNEQSEELKNIEQAISSLKQNLGIVIKSLPSKDFETFVDLIFRSAGWSRVGMLGKTIKDIDIELLAPVTNERAIVQVKSSSNLSTFNDYLVRFTKLGDYDRRFFVTHSPDDDLTNYIKHESDPMIDFWDADKLSELAIKGGLVDWLIDVTK